MGDVEFFYYFVESENNPAADPLLLYLNGGPGCCSLNGFLFHIGKIIDIHSSTSKIMENLLDFQVNILSRNRSSIFFAKQSLLLGSVYQIEW